MPRRSHRVLSLSLLVLSGASSLGLAACGGQAESLPPTRTVAVNALSVPVLSLQPATLSATLAVSGSLTPRSRVAIVPKVPGTLARVNVDIGDRVAAGQVVAVLDARDLEAQTDAAQAAVLVAKAALESAEAGAANAQLELERARNLFEKGAAPRQRLDAADTARRSAVAQRSLAEANVVQAEASARRAREVLRDATLVAPIAGWVVERKQDPGNLVSPGGDPVAVIADARELRLEAGVSELDAGRLQVGLPVTVTVEARPGVTYEGRLAAIAPEVDERNRHFRVEVRVQNPEGELLSGMYATARVETGRVENALAIPREAITAHEGKRVVWRVTDGAVVPVPIVEGLVDNGRVQVVSGLSSGDVIVADARRTLAPGTKVKPITRQP